MLELHEVTKDFGSTRAVDHINLEFPAGRISGLLGPNGAGKTTLIRMIMDIIKPDSGEIHLSGQWSDELRKNDIGYLPEERGLYTRERVRETLIYFAKLKGLDAKAAKRNVDDFLEQLGMTQVANQRIKQLSKGNQQKIQFIATVVSRPRLLILDEPFSGLDPVNVNLISGIIRGLHEEGMTIIFSTHQMNQVEEFCQNMFLMNRGKLILQGEVDPIIQGYSGAYFMVESDAPLDEGPAHHRVEQCKGATKVALNEGKSLHDLMRWIADEEIHIRGIKPYRVPLSEIFIAEVQRLDQ